MQRLWSYLLASPATEVSRVLDCWERLSHYVNACASASEWARARLCAWAESLFLLPDLQREMTDSALAARTPLLYALGVAARAWPHTRENLAVTLWRVWRDSPQSLWLPCALAAAYAGPHSTRYTWHGSAHVVVPGAELAPTRASAGTHGWGELVYTMSQHVSPNNSLGVACACACAATLLHLPDAFEAVCRAITVRVRVRRACKG